MTYTTDGQPSQQQTALSTRSARPLTTEVKTRPQMASITPRWLLKLLPWVEVKGGTFRVNRRQVVAPDSSFATNPEGEKSIDIMSAHEGETNLIETFVDYEDYPNEYSLSLVQTILKVHTRVADLYTDPFNQVKEQLRLTIEGLLERKESEIINNDGQGDPARAFGLLATAAPSMRIQTRNGRPTPDDMDELLAKVWKKPSFFLAHPQAIAAFGRECSRRGTLPPTIEMMGASFLTWRGIPMIPSDKLLIKDGSKTNILLLRVGEQEQGVIGLHKTGIPDEVVPGLSVRLMGVDQKAIATYLATLYMSSAILVPDALGVLENVDIASYYRYDEAGNPIETEQDLAGIKPMGSVPIAPVMARSFNGGDDYIEIKDPFQNPMSFTISLWLNPAILNDGGWHGVIGKQGDAYRKPGLWLTPGESGLHYDSYATTGERFGGVVNHFFESANQWIHITWVKDGTEYKFYRNGQLVETHAAPEQFYTVNTSYWIGRVDNFFSGQISDVQIWSRARSQADIQATMQRRLTGREPGLAGYWMLSEVGDTLSDSTPTGNTGTTHGTSSIISNPELRLAAPPATPIQPIRRPAILKFDGQSQYVEIANCNSFRLNQNFTLEAWIKSNCTGPIISKTQANPDGSLIGKALGIESSIPKFGARTSSGEWARLHQAQSVIPNDGAWHHIAFVFHAGTEPEQLLIDGRLANEYDVAQFIKEDDSGDRLRLGFGFGDPQNNSTPQYFQGELGEVRIWSKARTQAEIRATMTQQLAGNEGGLLAYWPFSEGTGNMIHDKTPNANHGIIYGATWVISDNIPWFATAT